LEVNSFSSSDEARNFVYLAEINPLNP